MLWSPFPGFQTRALACGADDALIGGAAGPGKTDCLIVFGLRFAHKPWFRGLILRRGLKELTEIADRLAALVPRLFPGSRYDSVGKTWYFPAGGWLRFGYCDRYADVEHFMGHQYTYIAWDEVGQVPEERWITKLITRLRSPDPEGQLNCFFRGSANPGGAGHGWIKRRYVAPCGKRGQRYAVIQDKLPDGRVVRQTRAFIPGRVKDNPILYNDPKYMSRLARLPERERLSLMEGDWDAAGGLAFQEISRETHVVQAIAKPPAHWRLFGGYDWGFAHWGVLCLMAQDDRGRIILLDSIWHRRMLPDQIAELVAESWDIRKFGIIYGGHDLWAEGGGKSDSTPAVADKLGNETNGWPLSKANIARVAGYQHLLDVTCYRGRGPGGSDTTPQLFLCDTPGNMRLLDQLLELSTDPDRPNDVLKVDADPETGKGGDDGYDALRYAIASHLPPPTDAPIEARSAFDPELLAAHAARIRTHSLEEREDAAIPLARDPAGYDSLWEVS